MLRLQTKLWFLKLITCLRQEAGRATVGEGGRKREEGRKREGRRDLSSLEPNNESVNKTPTHRQSHRARATSLSFVGGVRVGASSEGGMEGLTLFGYCFHFCK